jgi:hypothetical protein
MSEETIETTEEEETVETQEQDTTAEKMLKQSEVNKLLAKERKSHEIKFNTLKSSFDAFKKEVEDKEAEAEEAAKEKVEKLRNGLPENITKLLDKLSQQEQLEWLSDPTNKPERKTIPPLPDPTAPKGKARKVERVV